MTAAASRVAPSVSDHRDRRKRTCPRHRREKPDGQLNGLGQNSATSTPAEARSLSVLLAELVELGREAWRIRERERAVRAEIEALREIEENKD
jgi:hypothetical protein